MKQSIVIFVTVAIALLMMEIIFPNVFKKV